MATSGTRDGTVTVNGIITEALALLKIGVGGETLAYEYGVTGITTLKLMARAWAVKGIRLWLNETQSVTLADGTDSYAITKRPIEIYQAYRRTTGGNDVPIRLVSREEYSRFPNKTTGGAPFAAWVDRQRTATTAYVYPVPTATEVADGMTLRFDIKRPIEDPTALTEDLEVPPEYVPAAIYNLAIWIAPKFGKTPSDEVKALALSTLSDLSGADREGSVIMRVGRGR